MSQIISSIKMYFKMCFFSEGFPASFLAKDVDQLVQLINFIKLDYSFNYFNQLFKLIKSRQGDG